jgi:hypothetical protein
MMFVMLLWVCIHTGQAEKFVYNHGGKKYITRTINP